MLVHAIIIHNVRSILNVGSILRTADGLGIQKVYFTGYTPYPLVPRDSRLPHQSLRATARIRKTALGAETTLDLNHVPDVSILLSALKAENSDIVGLEQDTRSIDLSNFTPTANPITLVIGNEVTGLEENVRNECDYIVAIPMHGKKESFNVSVATGIALYELNRILQNR